MAEFTQYLPPIIKTTLMGSGCGTVGRAVTSNTGGPRFESSHQHFYKKTVLTANFTEKTTKKKWLLKIIIKMTLVS